MERRQQMPDLVQKSLTIIAAGQASSGAYVACPHFPTYHFCWFRDGAFIGHAMDLWGRYESAERFYEWACRIVRSRSATVERCVTASARGEMPDPADLLHTRYTLDGRTGDEDWPNFQLDGFGTLLWGLSRHIYLAGRPALPITWLEAMRLLVRYVAALWPYPNADCWEEFPDRVAVSTLAVLYAGLQAAHDVLGDDDRDGARASAAAAAIRARVLQDGVNVGHLIKQLGGDDVVDASLLWTCVPFGRDGLLDPRDELMRVTAARIEADLLGRTGGVHRYRADTYYGGGEWMLLTALLGEYRAAAGDMDGARACLAYVEAHADAEGRLPEQSSVAPLYPARVAEWRERWGPVACPLLWSHAAYLSLHAKVNGVTARA